MMRSSIFCALLILAGVDVAALETDQYYAWGRSIADATDVMNERVTGDIGVVLERINSKPGWQKMSCDRVVRELVPQFRQFIFADIEMWTVNTPLIERVPATPAEEITFLEDYLYHTNNPFDFGTKNPPSPTIELAGVRVGTDKLTHFFSEGWLYFKVYRDSMENGESREEAEYRAIKRGVALERTFLGLMWGVFSTSDLEANYQGMRFLVDLCEGEDPGLQKTSSGWRFVREFDFREYVTPEWDESYQTQIYGKRRWKKIRPALLKYCAMLDDPWVVRQRRDYMSRDVVTTTERIVERLVQDGKLPDPARFSTSAVCPNRDGDQPLVQTASGAAP